MKKQLKITHVEEKVFLSLGLFFIILVIINKVAHINLWGDFGEILWYCSIAATLLAIGMIFKIPALNSATLITAIFAQLLWIIDFFLYIQGSSLGRIDISFSVSPLIVQIISVSIHTFLIPVAAYAVWKMGFSQKSLHYAIIIYIVLLFSVTYLLTDPSGNRNCAFYPCDIDYNEAVSTGINFFEHFLKTVFFWIGLCVLSYLSFFWFFSWYAPKRIVL